MHGLITTCDNKKGVGYIQGDDGQIYFFTHAMVSSADEIPYLRMDRGVEFNPVEVEGRWEAHDMELQGISEDAEKELYYFEPKEFLCETKDLVSGYDVLDRAIFPLHRGERTEELARKALITECRSVGANSLVRYSVNVKQRAGIGYGYEVVTCTGVPVVLGKLDPNGDVRASDLKNHINQDRVRRLHNYMVNTKIGKMVLMFLAGVMLVVFTLGFFLSGGL